MRPRQRTLTSWTPIMLILAALLMHDVTRAQGKRTGSLTVLADSGATVYLNGQYSGMVTSAMDGLQFFDLTPGTYAVVLRRSGGASEEFKVDVKRGQRSTLDKRALRALSVPEPSAPVARPTPQVATQTADGSLLGVDRFVGLWREQRTGTYGNAHFEITYKDGKFLVQRTGQNFSADPVNATNMTDRTSGRSFGVVRLDGKVGHFGGTVSMSLVIHAVVRDPMKDLRSDTLAVEYRDVDGSGAKFEGSRRGFWVRMKR